MAPHLTSFFLCTIFALTAWADHGRDNTRRRHHARPSRNLSPGTYASVGYYPNWDPSNITTSTLTHILYAFADCDPVTGEAMLSDLWADQQIEYDGDDDSEPGNNLYGNFKQLYLMKQKKRDLKVSLSFGGWTYSQDGHFDFISNPTARATFVSTAIQLLEDNGLDGIDIDFEYPTADQKADLVSFITELRAGLDAYARSKGDTVPYQLTAAVPAGSTYYVNFDVAKLDPLFTFWNLMAYDYAGDWTNVTDDIANLYRGKTEEGVDTDSTIRWYLENGASRKKMNMGLPLYGRGWDNTTGLQRPYGSVAFGDDGDGYFNINTLPLPGAKVTEDFLTGASYSYDPKKKELISFDTPNIVREKALYVVAKGLGGTMYWDLSSDYSGDKSLVKTAIGEYANLDKTLNHLHYPNSQFDNMRSCMGACVAKTTTSSTTMTKTATTTGAATTTTSGPGNPCKTAKPWSVHNLYLKGDIVLFEFG
ncbi:glycoside hydrolase family 18 protein [Clavulina sp. PMI_390]|nr:glycoside hydrolase family 18 protein [Clavulina sp. PMI_390]